MNSYQWTTEYQNLKNTGSQHLCFLSFFVEWGEQETLKFLVFIDSKNKAKNSLSVVVVCVCVFNEYFVHTYMSQGRFFSRVKRSLFSLSHTTTATQHNAFLSRHILSLKISFHLTLHLLFSKNRKPSEKVWHGGRDGDVRKFKRWIKNQSVGSYSSTHTTIYTSFTTFTWKFNSNQEEDVYVRFFFRKRFLPFCFPTLTI